MSEIVQSPALVRDGKSSKINRTGQILRSMKMLDDAFLPANKSILPSIGSDSVTKELQSYDEDFEETLCRRSSLSYATTLNQTDVDMTYNLTQVCTPSKPAVDLDDLTFSAINNPGLSVVGGLFGDFKEKFLHHNTSGEIFDLVGAYKEICDDYVTLLKKFLSRCASDEIKSRIQEMKQLIVNEKHTWQLIFALYRNRLAHVKSDDVDMDIQSSIKYRSEKEAIEEHFRNNSDVRQAQIVIDWLEENASEELPLTAERFRHYSERSSWQNTLYQLKKKFETGRSTSHNLITEMDPDATTRTKKLLHELDREDEARFLKCILACIRAGKINEAEDLCTMHGQPWWVALLEGWRLHHDPNLTTASDDGGLFSLEGNARRSLWKLAAWHCSNNVEYDLRERAIYGSLCGNLKAMLDVSNSWEDQVWAYYKAMVDVASERFLQCFPYLQHPWQHVEDLSLPEDYFRQPCTLDNLIDVFEKISCSSDRIVAEEAKSPHHFIQRCIILNDMDGLLEQMLSWIESDAVSDQHLRFFAHLLLLLQAFGAPINPSKSVSVLKAYVQCLIDDERTGHLVAVYTSSLPPEEQLSCYSTFLETVTDSNMRRKYVKLAEEAGLDVRAITKHVVERIRSSGDARLFSLIAESATSDDRSVDLGLTPDDRHKVEAIEWLVFDPSQRHEALVQSNAVMRYFLASRKHGAARATLNMLPPDSIAVLHREWAAVAGRNAPLTPEMENTEKEHLCMHAFLLAHTAFSDWFTHFHKKPSPYDAANHSTTFSNVSMSDLVAEEQRLKVYSEDMEKWKSTLEFLCDDACDKIYNVLLFPNGGWLQDAHELSDTSDEASCRQRQLELLRRLYVPSLCDLLMNLLLNTGGRNEQCAKLADVIADDDNKLYKLFTNDEGRSLLQRIQEALVTTL